MSGANCLTLHQPWASLVATGIKTIETRSRRMNYRGRLYVHAAKRAVSAPELQATGCGLRHRIVYDGGPTRSFVTYGETEIEFPFPLGAVVGHVDVVDCLPIIGSMSDEDLAWYGGANEGRRLVDPGPTVVSGSVPMFGLRIIRSVVEGDRLSHLIRTHSGDGRPIEGQRQFGDFTPGRWAILLSNPVRYDEPIPAKGKQGLWTWDGAR